MIGEFDEPAVICDATRDVATCIVAGLTCFERFKFKASEICDDWRQSEYSVFTSSVEVLPPAGETCIQRAPAPARLRISNPTSYSLTLSWDPGLEDSCEFSHYQVMVRAGMLEFTPAACIG